MDHSLVIAKGFVWLKKLLKRWEYQATLPVFWEIWKQVKKQQVEPDMEQ